MDPAAMGLGGPENCCNAQQAPIRNQRQEAVAMGNEERCGTAPTAMSAVEGSAPSGGQTEVFSVLAVALSAALSWPVSWRDSMG